MKHQDSQLYNTTGLMTVLYIFSLMLLVRELEAKNLFRVDCFTSTINTSSCIENNTIIVSYRRSKIFKLFSLNKLEVVMNLVLFSQIFKQTLWLMLTSLLHIYFKLHSLLHTRSISSAWASILKFFPIDIPADPTSLVTFSNNKFKEAEILHSVVGA